MVYRIDNRPKKHKGRHIFLGIIVGIVLTAAAMLFYENNKELVGQNIEVVKKITIDATTSYQQPSNTNTQPRHIIQNIVGQKQLTPNDIAQEIHILVNQERENNGLSMLNWDSSIAQIAETHSNDMIINNYFDHRGLSQRLQDMGCPNGSENIAWVQQFKINEISQRMVSNWMASAIHRDNILNPIFSSEGIGVSIQGNYVIATDDFC